MSPSSLLRRALPLVVWGVVSALGGCGTRQEETIPRETFVEVYVELRVAALESEDAVVSAGDRERILEEHGVTAQDLLTFVEVHSLEPSYMRDVWGEIEDRLNVETLPPS